MKRETVYRRNLHLRCNSGRSLYLLGGALVRGSRKALTLPEGTHGTTAGSTIGANCDNSCMQAKSSANTRIQLLMHLSVQFHIMDIQFQGLFALHPGISVQNSSPLKKKLTIPSVATTVLVFWFYGLDGVRR